MNRWTVVGFLLLVAACDQRHGQRAPVEHYIADDGSVGFDLQPASGTGSHWIGVYAAQGKIARFRIELGPARGATTADGKALGITTGEGRFVPEAVSDSSLLLVDLRRVLQAKAAVQPAPGKTIVTFTFANIGDNLSQTEGGGFVDKPAGNWTALKLFLGEGENESEVFLNINPVIRKGQFSMKAPDYGDSVLRELAKVL